MTNEWRYYDIIIKSGCLWRQRERGWRERPSSRRGSVGGRWVRFCEWPGPDSAAEGDSLRYPHFAVGSEINHLSIHMRYFMDDSQVAKIKFESKKMEHMDFGLHFARYIHT